MSTRMAAQVGWLVLLTTHVCWAEVGTPVLVSPGSSTELLPTHDPCPTFSWGQAEGAEAYELVVYRLDDETEQEQPVIRRGFPGSVHSWTPAADRCLERGLRYAWSVRALRDDRPRGWSSPSLFQVIPGPRESELLDAFAAFRRRAAPERTPERQVRPGAPAVPRRRAAATPPEASAPASGASALTAYGDSCCDGRLPGSYAAELGNTEDTGDPDVLALVTSKKNQPAANVNYIGFFHREELGADPELVGEIEGDSAGGVHFTGSAASAPVSGWEIVSATDLQCGAGAGCEHLAICSTGKRVLSGGFRISTNQPHTMKWSYPEENDRWSVMFLNHGSATLVWNIYAVCADAVS